jgi:hypothetical protein
MFSHAMLYQQTFVAEALHSLRDYLCRITANLRQLLHSSSSSIIYNEQPGYPLPLFEVHAQEVQTN